MRLLQLVRPLAITVVLALPAAAGGQTATADREAVQRAALDYLEGFYEGDSTKHIRSIHPSVYKYGFFYRANESRYNGSQMRWEGFHAYTRNVRSTGERAPANAPKEVLVFEVLDQTASVKVTAFWGIDYLLLAKFDGKWMITHVLWQTPPRAPAR
jgi:hypothetical protein